MASTLSSCGPMRLEVKEQIDRYKKVEEYWNGVWDSNKKKYVGPRWKNIQARYNNLELGQNSMQVPGVNTPKEQKSFGYKMLDEIAMQVLKKPFDPALPIEQSQFKRLVSRLDRLDRDIGAGKLSWFDTIFKPRQALANRYPEVSYFLKNLSKVSNYERNQNVQYAQGVDKVSKNLTAALLEAEGKTGSGAAVYKTARFVGKQDPNLAKIDELWEGLIIARNEGDTSKLRKINTYLGEVAGKHADNVVGKLLDYVENGVQTEKINGKEVRISKHIINAGNEMRNFFNNMGAVTIQGLKESVNTVSIAFFGTDTPTKVHLSTDLGKAYLNSKKMLSEVISGLETRIEENTLENLIKSRQAGEVFRGYFPHYLITEYGKIRDKTNELFLRSSQKDGDKKFDGPGAAMRWLTDATSGLDKIIQEFGKTAPLHRARGRMMQEGLSLAWQKNPIGVMKRYAQDTIAFNKIHHVQSSYLRLMQNLKSVAGEEGFYKNMRDYINDMYTVTTRGYIDRPVAVNNIVKAITSAEFASKLGFGVTSAARNFLSGNHYLAAVGYKTWGNAMKRYKTDAELAGIINGIEEKQGFKFKDANIAAITEGLLPSTGVDRNSIQYDEYKEEIKYRRNGKWESIDKQMSKTAGKMAWFHAVGENAIRKNMFRTTWIMTYDALKESPEYVLTRSGGDGEQTLHTIATNAALVAVNTYAYEYSAFGKAPIIGGTSRNFGAAGQLLGQFMHYPMSFANQQWHMLRSAGESIAAGEYRSPEVKASMRYAGIYAFIHLLSGTINLDLSHLFENDTAERMKDFINFLSADTDEEAEKVFHGSGLATQVIGGPFVSDLIFYGNVMGMYRMPDNDLAQIIFGYTDMYNKTDREKSERILQHINVEVSKWVYKDWPSIVSGNAEEVLRHELGLYPRAWTKRHFYEKPWGLGKHFGERISVKGKRRAAAPSRRRRPSYLARTQSELSKLHKAMGL